MEMVKRIQNMIQKSISIMKSGSISILFECCVDVHNFILFLSQVAYGMKISIEFRFGNK